MDPRSLDALARHLAAGLPRRQTLGLAGSLAAVLALGRALPAAAACKKVGRKCDKNKDCCDGARCKGDKKGKKGKCKCKSAREEYDKKCYDLAKDANHCGICDNACQSGVCRDGVCACGGITEDDCPDWCTCAISLVGLVCIGSTTPLDIPCQGNSDCPPASACVVSVDGLRCAVPCVS